MEIGPGDWFLASDSVTKWTNSSGDRQHRYIVIFERLGQLIVLARSSDRQNYSGRKHDKHDGICMESTCKLDRDGRISSDPVSPIDIHRVKGGRSCKEPDDDVIEWIWDHVPRGRT